MNSQPIVLILAFAGAALAACAAPFSGPTAAAGPTEAGRQCFWAQSVSGFRALDDRTVNLRVGVNEIYQLELFGTCPDIDWAEQIGIESRGTSTICTGLDATLIAPSNIGPQRCQARTVRRLTPAEVAALPDKARP